MNHFLLKSKALEFLSHCVNDEIGKETTFYPDDRIRKVKEKIDMSYHSPLQVNQLAKEFDIPTLMLQNKFKQSYRYTVYRYVQKRRRDVAAEELLTTDQSITDISIKVGYDNPSKFATVFKKHYGETPLHYRRKYRLQEKYF